MQFDLSGKVALITGSSRGIGRAIAEELASLGAKVVISSRNQDACNEAAAAVKALHGDDAAFAVAASISCKDDLRRLVDASCERFGAIDVLVCNAATNPYYGPMSKIDDEQFLKVLTNNVIANNWLIQMVVPKMIERRDGSIIVVSSIGGMVGSDTIGAYNISKAADFQLVRNLAVELGRHNIRVNSLAPGVIRTDFAKAIWDNPKAEAVLARMTPLGRIGEPAEIAGAAGFLASQASAYMTGQAIVIDGGVTVGSPS